ncbi:MAG: hypothetical protein ACR652_05780 [Methylocystis sp.]|uniref:hypothetical protein n=1 Tax=Methylocystis sp. TaxID=1911079 RepID=UPI003DA312B3
MKKATGVSLTGYSYPPRNSDCGEFLRKYHGLKQNSDTPIKHQTFGAVLSHLVPMQKTAQDLAKKDKRFGNVADQLGAEISRLRDLEMAVGLRRPAETPSGMSLQQVLDFHELGLSLTDIEAARDLKLSLADARDLIADAKYAGLSLTEAYDFREFLTTPEAKSLTFEEARGQFVLKRLANEGFHPVEAKLLSDAGLSVAEGKIYRAKRLPITADTIIGGMRDSNLTRPLTLTIPREERTAYKGRPPQLFDAHYQTPHGPFVGVFKVLPDITGDKVERSDVAKLIGIDLTNPNTAMRCLATYDIARKLGFYVIPPTELGIHKLPTGRVELGVVTGGAMGASGDDSPPEIFKIPEVRKKLTELQLLDALAGVGGRCAENYFIAVDPYNDVVIVAGIDNGRCWGTTKDPSDVAYGISKGELDLVGVYLPKVVDTDMIAAFANLTPATLADTLSDMLTPQEIEAAQSRLDKIKLHLQDLTENGRVIDPEQWGSEQIDWIANEASASYFVRDDPSRQSYERVLRSEDEA